VSTLSVRVATSNRGTVYVRVWVYLSPGPRFEWSGTATSDKPVDQNWVDLEPGHYAVTISWAEGYHNIGWDNGRNAIIYNGNELYYQITGRAGPYEQVIGTFGLVI